MTVIKFLKKLSAIELVSFLIAGIFNTILCYFIFTAALVLGFTSVLSMTLATLVTIPVSFYIMGRYVFASEFSIKRSISFIIMQIAGCIINISILLLVLWIGVPDYFSGLISLALTAVIIFFASKFLVFDKPTVKLILKGQKDV
jgi:putative flippase GtrA